MVALIAAVLIVIAVAVALVALAETAPIWIGLLFWGGVIYVVYLAIVGIASYELPPVAEIKARTEEIRAAMPVEEVPEPIKVKPTKPTRTWTSSDGKYTTLACLVKSNPTTVTLEKVDGKIISVEQVKLSVDDQKYVRNCCKGIPQCQ